MKWPKAWVMLLILSVLLSGCGATKAVSTPANLTTNQAAEIIYQDLIFHGVKVGKVNVDSLSFDGKNSASVTFSYPSTDGKNNTQKTTLKKTDGKWTISGHSH